MRYDLESTLPERAFKKSLFKNAPATLEGGKGGGGAPTQTTSTSNTSNIPEYAQPYVETMLGATQRQLFNMDDSGNITGFQPYKAYGGTYDAKGNQTSYDPSKAVAGFSPMQQQAQQSAANLQVPGQYGQAAGMTGIAGLGALGTTRQAGQYGGMGMGYGALGAQQGLGFGQQAQDPNAVMNYMNPYLQASLNPQLAEIQRQYDITGQGQQGAATKSGAFGGSRDALMAAENQRNKNTAMNQVIGQGYNQAFNNAQQQMATAAQLGMQGAGMGMQGAGIGLQGIGAQQAGYGQLGQAASSLAGIGGQELAAQQGIIGTQNQIGAQQQANKQQIINQAMQDYANAQQYPIMQLGTMSNMLRGLPMQAQTTQQYQAQANPITQGIGALGAGASLYNATKAAEGGIMSYDAGGAIRATLENMPNESLQKQLATTSSDSVKNDIKEILAQRKMADVKTAKDGGILSYKNGETTNVSVSPEEIQANKEKYEANKGILGGGIASGFTAKDVPFRDSNPYMAQDFRNDVQANIIDPVANFYSDKFGAKAKQREEALKGNISQDAAYSEFKRMQNRGPAKPGSTEDAIENIRAGDIPPVTTFNTIGQTQTTPKDGTVKPSVNASTKEKVNPNAITAATPNPKVSQSVIDVAKENNPKFTEALGGNKPEDFAGKTLKLYKDLASELGVSTKPPVDENAGLTTAQIAAKDEEARNKFLGKNPSADRRQQIMAEKANAADEAKRTQAMRMAEFFAMWGSTPGNTIVAGLNAMKNKMPDFILDKKEASKMRREIDKSIADLDQVDYLEKSGRFDAAEKKRQEAIKNGMQWGTEMSRLLSHVATSAIKDESDTQREHIRGKYGVTEAQIRANATMASKGGNEDKAFKTIETAYLNNERVIESKVKSNGSLERDMNTVKRFESKESLTDAQKRKLESAKTNLNNELGPLYKNREVLTKKLQQYNSGNVEPPKETNVDKSKRPPLNSFQQ
jgi:hypothetical protein